MLVVPDIRAGTSHLNYSLCISKMLASSSLFKTLLGLSRPQTCNLLSHHHADIACRLRKQDIAQTHRCTHRTQLMLLK